MSNEVNDFLFGGGAKSWKHDTVGDIVRGTVVKTQVLQQTAIDTQEPLTWPDGRKRMQLVITLQTNDHDGDDDDGLRTIYAKGGNYEVASGEGTSMKDAIADAMKAAGAKGIDPGDELAVGYTGIGKARKGFNAPKLYAANFRKGSTSVSASDLFGDGNERAGDPF